MVHIMFAPKIRKSFKTFHTPTNSPKRRLKTTNLSHHATSGAFLRNCYCYLERDNLTAYFGREGDG